jgi:hypothetical protein
MFGMVWMYFARTPSPPETSQKAPCGALFVVLSNQSIKMRGGYRLPSLKGKSRVSHSSIVALFYCRRVRCSKLQIAGRPHW